MDCYSKRGNPYLADADFVGEAHDHAVLCGVVLVLVLGYKPFPGAVVGLSLYAMGKKKKKR